MRIRFPQIEVVDLLTHFARNFFFQRRIIVVREIFFERERVDLPTNLFNLFGGQFGREKIVARAFGGALFRGFLLRNRFIGEHVEEGPLDDNIVRDLSVGFAF